MARRISNLKSRDWFQARMLLGLFFKPLHLFCEACDKHVPSTMHWKCSHCDFINVRTKYYSFLHKCQQCKREARSYACPHCDKINFLDSTKYAGHPARSSSRPPPLVETVADKQRKFAEKRMEIQQEIEITELNARLAKLKASPEFQKQVSAKEKLELHFSDHDAHTMGVKAIVRERRREAMEKYKNDPEALEDQMESIDQWADMMNR